MRLWTSLLGAAVVAAGSFGSSSANADVICAGCLFDFPNGTYLGSYDPATNDVGTFVHAVGTDYNANQAFEDRWVFDVESGASASISADFTSLASIADFTGALFADNGSDCGLAPAPGDDCTAIAFIGAALDSESAGGTLGWELLVNNLAAGRYVVVIAGTNNAADNSAYTGQLSFVATPVSEPGTLGLLALAIFAAGAVARSRKV